MAFRSRRGRTRAPAKMNLHLQIRGKRPDGFHDLVSLFIMTSLADEIEIMTRRPGAGFSLSGRFSCPVDKNLITRAVNAYCEKSGMAADFSVRAKKRIPEGAGLGGGSSDAAAVLRILSGLFPDRLSTAELASIAASLGSDVPFFLAGPAAMVEGRGERITRVPARSDFTILLCIPDFQVNTREAYSWLDSAREALRQDLTENAAVATLVRDYQEKSPGEWKYFNSFFSVLKEHFGDYQDIEGAMRRAKTDFSTLSGSGSSYAGIFSDKKGARKALKILRKHVGSCMVVSPLTSLPKVEVGLQVAGI